VKIAWTHEQDLVKGRMLWAGGSLSDLDQDGQLEVTVAEYDGSAWATRIYDARDGTKLAEIPNTTSLESWIWTTTARWSC